MREGTQGRASALPAPHFRTDDLALAAALHAETDGGGERCYPLLRVEAVGRKAFFIFASTGEIVAFIEDYHDGGVEVEPRRLLQAAAHCRNLMFEALDAARPRHDRNGR